MMSPNDSGLGAPPPRSSLSNAFGPPRNTAPAQEGARLARREADEVGGETPPLPAAKPYDSVFSVNEFGQ